MSLLLDALNKAERERKRNETTPGINSNHERVDDSVSHAKTTFIVLLVVAVISIGLTGIYWLGKKSANQAPTKSATTDAPAPQYKTASSATPKSAATTPNKQIDKTIDVNNMKDDIDTSDENVASLYQQNTQTQTANATLTINTPTAVSENMTGTDQNIGSPTSINQFANLPDLHDLPNQVLEKIPSLNYSEHNFNTNGGSVKINGVIHHANDQLAPGLVIDKILEDGMILHTDNYSFKMRALNSWVNM